MKKIYAKKSMPSRIILGIVSLVCLASGLYYGAVAVFHIGISPTEIREMGTDIAGVFITADGGLLCVCSLFVAVLLAVLALKK